MMKRHQWLVVSVALLGLMIILGACREREQSRIVRDQLPMTQTQEAYATQTHAPPTPGPSPTPTATSTPYLTATPFPDTDPEMVVASVGNQEITLAEYQARVRYERWLPLVGIRRSIELQGVEAVLDLTRSENARTLALFYTLGDAESMGAQTMNAILTEQVVLREAGLLELQLDQTFFDGRLAARIGVELGEGAARPPEWDEAYATFVEEMILYTGMSEEQLLEHIRALTYYDQLSQLISPRATLPNEGITAVSVESILMNTLEEAVDVQQRLLNGELMVSIAASYDMVLVGDSAQHTIRRGDENLPADVIDAIFAASEGEVVGPIATQGGWFVAVVLDIELDILSPGDIEAIRSEYFRQWILERLDNPEYTVDYENWREFTPADPLPRDVSPMMRDEFFTLPENPFEASDLDTPTPLPIGIAPR